MAAHFEGTLAPAAEALVSKLDAPGSDGGGGDGNGDVMAVRPQQRS
ncbi:hypothetical protein ACP4OV_018574 [Aristida adscensionis]